MIYVYGILITIAYNNYIINYNHRRLLTVYCLCIVVAGKKKLQKNLSRVCVNIIFYNNMVFHAHSMFGESHGIFL